MHSTAMRSKYGPRGRRNHNGVDIPLKIGEPIYAAFDGTPDAKKANGDTIHPDKAVSLSYRSGLSGEAVFIGSKPPQGGITAVPKCALLQN